MGNAPRDEDGYLRAVSETLTEWNSPEDEAAWPDETPGSQRAAPEQEPPPGRNLESAIRDRFAPLGGVELDPPPDEPVREPPRLD